jgi:WD40-like Beta Propeller Repeat/N-acetylmuramoyl-L-alanine amidase
MKHAQPRFTRSPMRAAARGACVLVPLLLSLSLPAGPAHAAASAIPPTVIRSTPLPLATMVQGLPLSAVGVEGDGSIRATRRVTTAARVLCAPIAFTEVGVSWTQPGRSTAPVSAVVQSASRASGPFTRGVRVGDDTWGEGPDPGSSEFRPGLHATEPLWTDTSRCVRLSMRLPAGVTLSNTTVVFLNTLGTAFGGRPMLTPLPIPEGSAGSGAGTDLRSIAARPTIITRTQWGADDKLINCFFGYAPGLKAAFVHHTDTPNGYSAGQSAAIVRGIYAYHTNVNKWCDIGYNFLVDRFGRIFEGRQGGVNQPVIPAAQRGFNTYGTAVAGIGTFTSAAPSSAMVTSIEKVVAWRLAQANRSPTGYAWMQSSGGQGVRYKKGQWAHLHEVSGHRNVDFTACPGNALYSRLPAIRAAAARMISHGPGATLVYASDRSGSSQVWAERPDGSELRRITNVAQGAFNPALSPDGSRVAYVRGTGNAADIFIEPLAGGTPRQVTDSAGFDGAPAWSPDGHRLAFVSERDGNDDIWTTDLQTDSLRQVTTSASDDTDPSWAATGHALAFASDRSGNVDLWTFNLLSDALTQRTFSDANDGQPAWSPDGTELAFVSDRDGSDDIWTLDLESRKIRQLDTDPSADDAPSWAGNSASIAFQTGRTGQDEIFLVGLNTVNVHQLTSSGGSAPSWRN